MFWLENLQILAIDVQKMRHLVQNLKMLRNLKFGGAFRSSSLQPWYDPGVSFTATLFAICKLCPCYCWVIQWITKFASFENTIHDAKSMTLLTKTLDIEIQRLSPIRQLSVALVDCSLISTAQSFILTLRFYVLFCCDGCVDSLFFAVGKSLVRACSLVGWVEWCWLLLASSLC